MHQNNNERSFRVKLGFSSVADTVAEDDGGLRIPTRFDVEGSGGATETHWCSATDIAGDRGRLPGFAAGFDQIQLGERAQLQAVLARVREAGELSEADARIIRQEIQGKRFRLSDGRRLRVLFVAPEGFIMRRSGPNGLDVSSGQPMTERNGHKAADQVHGDQNVYGTPVRQMLKGVAPWLFRHQTLGRSNRFSPVCLLNLWLPLQQCVQPLTLADRRTIDAERQQIRYALPTGDFLDRDQDKALNDIWLFLHDPQQHWYCDSAMTSDRAYVFDTLGTPHGASTLPGEEVAEAIFIGLNKLLEHIEKGRFDAVASDLPSLPGVPEETPERLRCVLALAGNLFAEARECPNTHVDLEPLARRARELCHALTRQSLEMRLVALVY